MATAEHKFRIILADQATMRKEFPLARQQEMANQSATFFVEAGESISDKDIAKQINEWNKSNIIAILIHGLISQELAVTDEDLTAKHGVPVVRVDTRPAYKFEDDLII